MSQSAREVLPNHVGLILDGNRRWAKQHGVPAFEGHRQGVKVFKKIVRQAFTNGVHYVSAYVFSTENWNRTKDEVSFLMSLLLRVVDEELKELEAEGIKILIVGSRSGLTKKVIRAIERAEARTKNNQKGILALCLNYGGQMELVDAMRAIVSKQIPAENITAELIAAHLYAPEIPPIDLVIRTSGEHRLSNFMLWRSAYSELIFVDKFWPAFTANDFTAALQEFSRRQRRFGA
jgi:undecaprenyl diphosphate synthase